MSINTFPSRKKFYQVSTFRANGYNGIVRWTTIVSIKKQSSPIFNAILGVTKDDIAVISITQEETITIMRVDGNGIVIQVIAFINKVLNYSIMNPILVLSPVSDNHFVLCYQTNQQFGISDLTGVDLAVLYGGFDLNVSYSLMVDFGYDAPNLSQFVTNQNYSYMVYNSANSEPQIMIKYRTDFFSDLTYNGTSSNST